MALKKSTQFEQNLSRFYYGPKKIDLNSAQIEFFKTLHEDLKNNWNNYKTDKDLHERLYEIMHSIEGLKPIDIFPKVYLSLIGKEKGPKLAGFIKTIGQEKALKLIDRTNC